MIRLKNEHRASTIRIQSRIKSKYAKMPLKIFISYSHEDRSVADEVIQIIDEIGIDFTYFIDHKDVAWSDHVTPSIKQGMEECSDILVVISESSLASIWIGYEIGIADSLGRKVLLYPIEKNLELPSFLSDINYKTRADLEEVKDYLKSRAAQPLVEEFLEKIGRKNNLIYKQIDTVYVPPIEFDDIKKAFEDKRIVVVTGPREFGKTYTAVRLLWEYYKKGYVPQWKSGEDLANIERDGLQPRQVVYYEDPFGSAEYQRIEGLERQIGIIPELVKQSEDSYVIITSPEEVYKEFEERSMTRLEPFETRLRLATPSYNLEQRQKILLQWAEEDGCKWLTNYGLKHFVLDAMQDTKKLPTPLSIRNFVRRSAHNNTEEELKENIISESKATEVIFAHEIEKMPADMMLFLAFPLLANLDIEWAEKTYGDLIADLAIRYPMGGGHPWSFDQVLNWFRRDKIEIFKWARSEPPWIIFSHPSYLKALDLLRKQTKFLKILEMLVTPIIHRPWADKGESRFARALVKIGTPAVAPLITALNDNDELVRYRAAGALVEIQDARAVEPLINALGDENLHVRFRAAGALGYLGDSRAVDALINALGDKEPDVRSVVATALGFIGDSRAVEPLIHTLGDESEICHSAAVFSLGWVGKAATEPLVRALRDHYDPRVRIGAALALGWRVDKRAVIALRAAARDRHAGVRRAAGNALVDMGYWRKRLFRGLEDDEWPCSDKPF